MNFDEVQALWRSQDARPPYSFDEYILRYIVDQRRKELSRLFFREMVGVYGATLLALLGASLLPIAMYFSETFRTALDIVLVIGSVAPLLICAVAIHVVHARRKRLEPSFTSPLREAIERDLQRIDYEISRRTAFRHMLTMQGLPLISGVVIAIACIRINSMTLPIWFGPYLTLVVVGCLAWGVRSNNRRLERDLYPRRQELQALREKLNGVP